MTTVSLGYFPRDWQRECHRKRRRFTVYALHRRAGKTELAIMELIDKAMRFDRELGLFFYVAPYLKQAKAIASMEAVRAVGRANGQNFIAILIPCHRVIAANGAPVGWLAAFTRNVMRTVDMLPFGYATGLLASLADPWGRRLGDMVAGTLVVHDARPHEPQAAPVSAALAPAVVLLPHEQAALVAFGERGPQLTQERQAELADLAEPLVQARGSLAVARLYGIANWLLGRRS